MENLLLDLKRAVQLTEPEQFCKDEWSKTVASRCASLIETFPHRLSAVIAAKGASTTTTDLRGLNTHAITYLTLYILN